MGMDKVDWGKMQVDSRAVTQTPSRFDKQGDPTAWGGADTVLLTPGGGQQTPTKQLILAQCDLYPANWQCIGNIGLIQEFWDIIDVDPTEFPIWAEVTMGVGQQNIMQQFDLVALINNAAPWYRDTVGGDSTTAALVVKPWVISGGIVGRQVSLRVFFAPTAVIGAPAFGFAQAQISTFSAGFGGAG